MLPRPPKTTLFPYTTLFRSTARTDSSLLYVVSSNSQLVKSTDGGATWSTPATEFLPQLYPQYIEVDPSNADIADRKSTRLNSSHSQISYAVFCLKKKTKNNK